MLYQMVELEDGVEVQYLAVYALRWRPEWGEPSVGFVETEEYDKLLEEHKALQELLAIRDSEVDELRAELENVLLEWVY